MSVAGRNAPLSPISVGGSEWSLGKYNSGDDSGPFPSGRGNLASPPNSGGSNGTMSINGFPSGPGNGGPSPPPSVGRSSQAMSMHNRSDSARNSTARGDFDDSVLNEHYVALRAFLTARDHTIKPQPNKARDKLLRLSGVQFYELSTDVFDELMRRQATARTPPNAPNRPPAFLLPEKTFHPKRNQARQRLSSLGPPRFRDLATDVFHELERRYPRFLASDIPRLGSGMSMRGGPSRTGTPVNGYGPRGPPGGPPRMRRPSDASSMRGPPPMDVYGVPPSPGLPGAPMQKQLQGNNTIVPNKSTMLEEDDDGLDVFGLERVATGRDSKGSGMASEVDKKLIEDYQTQVKDLKDKIDDMENELSGERSRATAANLEKKEWDDMRLNLENKLAEAQHLNDSMKSELDRVRDDHEQETHLLEEQLAALQMTGGGKADEALQRENDDLRRSLHEQQQTTDEVRREAQEFLREMRSLSQQSTATYEKQLEMEKTIEHLEQEARDWRNRYTRSKTQLGSMRASSIGLPIDHDASRYVREKGLIDDHGAVKDIHVTKFQIAIDDLLQRARSDHPDKVMVAMKSTVVSVRRITKDLDQYAPVDDSAAQLQSKLKARVASMANGLITTAKHFSSGGGLTPVSLLDSAASHLTGAVVELIKVVKIRPTPPGDLEDYDEGTETPLESGSFFSPRSTTQASVTRGSLPPPPPFQGLGGMRASADSSAYSPVSSPRESVYSKRITNGTTNGYLGGNKSMSGLSNGYAVQAHDSRTGDLKVYLDDQTTLLVSDIQTLVGSIRGDGTARQIGAEIQSIGIIVGKIVEEAQACGHAALVDQLESCRGQLQDAGRHGQELARAGVDSGDQEWRSWTQALPPLAFEIARETKELVQRIGEIVMADGMDDFS